MAGYSYRVFVDTLGNTHYYRKNASNSVLITADIGPEETVIPVTEVLPLFNNDLTFLNRFNNAPLVPQAAWINNERIEFFAVDGNNLVQCLRGTAGTSAVLHSFGDRLWDGSERQSLIAEANRTGSAFSVEDVKTFPWPQSVIDFLAGI